MCSPRYRPGAALLALFLGLVANVAHAQVGGGTPDTHGVIWSPSQVGATGSYWTWTAASRRAADYVRTDATGTYSDWELPTIAEVQWALADGTLQWLIPLNADGTAMYGSVPVWTSQTKGQKAYAVRLFVDPPTGLIDYSRSGQVELLSKTSWGEAFFVR
jgi:hypothetical protein